MAPHPHICVLNRLLFNGVQSQRGNQQDGFELAHDSTTWKVWDFDFLQGLAPGRLDGFSIERYERNLVPFGLSVGGFES